MGVVQLLRLEARSSALLNLWHPSSDVEGTLTDGSTALDSGPVGWVEANGDGERAVAVRSAPVLPNGNITAYVVARIVADSVPERELVETRLKFRPIVEAFD